MVQVQSFMRHRETSRHIKTFYSHNVQRESYDGLKCGSVEKMITGNVLPGILSSRSRTKVNTKVDC